MIRELYRTDLDRHLFATGRSVGHQGRRRRTWRSRWCFRLAAILGLALTAVGCDDDTNGPSGPEVREEGQLDFVTFRPDAPPLTTTDTTFWAVKGDGRRLIIRQQPEEPGNEGDEFLRFEVKSGSLLRRPDGTLFQEGDSVLIRVILDPDRILAEFRPSGLEFDPDDPARLEIEYEDAEDEFLTDLEAEIDLWRQERPGEPWLRLGTVQLEDLDEIEADLTGFTRFALAIGR